METYLPLWNLIPCSGNLYIFFPGTTSNQSLSQASLKFSHEEIKNRKQKHTHTHTEQESMQLSLFSHIPHLSLSHLTSAIWYRNPNFLPIFFLSQRFPRFTISSPTSLNTTVYGRELDGNPNGIGGKPCVFSSSYLVVSVIRQDRISEMVPLASAHYILLSVFFIHNKQGGKTSHIFHQSVLLTMPVNYG